MEEPSHPGWLVNWLLSTLVSMGATAFFLKAHDNPATVELSSLRHPRPFLNYLAAMVVVTLANGVELILLIVPGIIAALMFMFTTFIIIDRERGPIEAMKESAALARGHKWPLLGFLLMVLLINLAGLLALVVGLLVSIPVTTLAFAHVYRVLTANMSGGVLTPPGFSGLQAPGMSRESAKPARYGQVAMDSGSPISGRFQHQNFALG